MKTFLNADLDIIKNLVDSYNTKKLNQIKMAEKVQISCINKTNRESEYDCIGFVGGTHANAKWKLSLTDAIKGIESGRYSFYTSVGGHVRNVVVASRNGVKDLKTESDNDTPDNLLSLPECG